MMGGALVPNDVGSKVALDAVTCATQLNGLVVTEVNGKQMTCDMHIFDANPKWSKNLCIWGEVGVVTVGKIQKG